MQPNKRGCSLRLGDALWAYRTTYQWSLNTKLFGPLNNVTWIYDAAGIARKLPLQELEEIRNDAYGNTSISCWS